jgi:hypothetical protein
MAAFDDNMLLEATHQHLVLQCPWSLGPAGWVYVKYATAGCQDQTSLPKANLRYFEVSAEFHK